MSVSILGNSITTTGPCLGCCTGTGNDQILAECCDLGTGTGTAPQSIPTVLYGTLINATGDCVGYSPTSWTFIYDPVNSNPGAGSFLWNADGPGLTSGQQPVLPGSATSTALTLACQDTGAGYTWTIAGYSYVIDCQTSSPTSFCDPLLLTFDFLGSADPACNNDDGSLAIPPFYLCSGTYQIVVTE